MESCHPKRIVEAHPEPHPLHPHTHARTHAYTHPFGGGLVACAAAAATSDEPDGGAAGEEDGGEELAPPLRVLVVRLQDRGAKARGRGKNRGCRGGRQLSNLPQRSQLRKMPHIWNRRPGSPGRDKEAASPQHWQSPALQLGMRQVMRAVMNRRSEHEFSHVLNSTACR